LPGAVAGPPAMVNDEPLSFPPNGSGFAALTFSIPGSAASYGRSCS
jgi:hypothetical protein